MLATAPPGTIFMAGGLPNPALFPFQSLTVELDSKTKLNLDQTALRAALQYQPTSGCVSNKITNIQAIHKM